MMESAHPTHVKKVSSVRYVRYVHIPFSVEMNVSNIYLLQMKTNRHTSHDAYKMKIFAMI